MSVTYKTITKNEIDLEESEVSYITNLLYGSTEAEPINTISAKEKMELEGIQCVGHCVGRPVFKGSVKVIKILDGE